VTFGVFSVAPGRNRLYYGFKYRAVKPPIIEGRKKLRPENRLFLPGFQGKVIFSQFIVATVERFNYIPRPASLRGGIGV
jgi:hypothetical protein